MVELCDVSGTLGEFSLVDISLEVKDGEYLVLLGPTGAGKTVLIEYMVGIYRPDSGRILVNGRDIIPLAIDQRNIAYVPQDYALFPNMTVEKNIAYGLESRRVPGHRIIEVVRRIMKRLGIDHLKDRMPLNLSGGEKQRVALGRALAPGPDLVLLDEPLSALDENLRSTMAKGLRKLQQDTHATFIHVCHNFEEASEVADRIAIMNQGGLVQTGSLDEIKARPENEFVARFLKTRNIFHTVSVDGAVSVNGNTFRTCSDISGDVVMAIRSENILIDENPGLKEVETMQARVVDVMSRPHFYEILLDAGMPLVVYRIQNSLSAGDVVTVHIPREHIIVMRKRYTGQHGSFM